MDSWRRQKGGIHHQEVQNTRSHSRKPPQASWQPTVPSWEKKFCTSVGSVPWRKILETKRLLYLYENVVQWNDSAGEEAFQNAKNRFWADINGLPCNISLPDPDIYIDEIDWNSSVDPELLLDLEWEPKATEEIDKDKKAVSLNSALLLDRSLSCADWGDAERDFHKGDELCLDPSYGDGTQNAKTVNAENSWDRNCAPCSEAMKDDGWGNCLNNSWEWSQHNNDYNEWKNVNNGSGGDLGMFGIGYISRYKTSRFHGGDYRVDCWWKNGRGWKRSNIACQKHSSRHWDSMKPHGPISHKGFGKAGISWGLETQVS